MYWQVKAIQTRFNPETHASLAVMLPPFYLADSDLTEPAPSLEQRGLQIRRLALTTLCNSRKDVTTELEIRPIN